MESIWPDGKGAHGRAEPKGYKNFIVPIPRILREIKNSQTLCGRINCLK